MSAPRETGLDTQPHPLFRTYSAGNFAEVAPRRLSVMSWSLLGDPAERGVRALASKLWPSATWFTGSYYVFFGYFTCRPYHNLAGFCHMARELPGLEPRDVTASYFEDAPTPEPVSSHLATHATRAIAIPRLVSELISLRPRMTTLESEIVKLEESARAAVQAESGPALGACLASARATLDRAWALHYSTTLSLVPLRAIHRALGRRLLDHWSELEPWLGNPGELAWRSLAERRAIGSPYGPAELLDSAFYEVADTHEPWCQYVVRQSAGEQEPPAPQTGSSPADVLCGIESRARLALMPQLGRVLGDSMALRESSKALAMRCLHVFRGLLPAVAAQSGVAENVWPYLTVSELADIHLHPELGERVDNRRALCAAALEREMPEELRIDSSEALMSRPVRVPRAARGISPGRVTGVVVDHSSARLRCDAPKVLVCESADADMQPILPLVDGILTERGSALSHIAILVREHGIPAIVGHPLASDLTPGQWVAIDGTRGEVTIVERR